MKESVSAFNRLLPLAGVAALALLSAGGSIVARATGIVVPGPVLGMAAYLALLLLAPRAFGWTLSGARLLTSILGALIVPAAVGLAGFTPELGADALPLAATLILSTLVTGVATAALYRVLARA